MRENVFRKKSLAYFIRNFNIGRIIKPNCEGFAHHTLEKQTISRDNPTHWA